MIQKGIQHIRALDYLLPRNSKIKLMLLVGVQFLISILDLGGLLLVGWIATLSIAKVQGVPQSDSLSIFFELLNVSNSNFQEQIMILCVMALIFFTFKTITSLYLLKRVYNFLAFEVVLAGKKTLNQLFDSSKIEFKKEKPQELLNSVTSGIIYLVLGYLGSQVVILTDIFLLIMIGAATFIVSPVVAIFGVFYFGLIIILINSYLSKQSRNLGKKVASSSMESNQQILDSFAIYRELYLLNDFDFALKRYTRLRHDVSYTNAKLMFVPNVSKYLLELSLVLGTALLAAIELLRGDPLESIGGVAIFFVAATRAFPAILRSQAASITSKLSLGHSHVTVDYLDKLMSPFLANPTVPTNLMDEFSPNILFEGVTFEYGSDSQFRFKNVSFEVPSGSTLGIAGPSGGGKSTLIDLIIGLNVPQHGKILISGGSPREIINKFPGRIAYVPQSIPIIQGTLLENILLGRDCETKQEKLWLEELLVVSGLDLEIKTMNDGLYTTVGPKEISLSGGQAQRLGIARALYSKPKLIILDEATSSLDAISEHQISQRILSCNKDSTIIVVAHRLSTLIECNQIIYLKQGAISGIGSFAMLKDTNAEFRKQANLSGL